MGDVILIVDGARMEELLRGSGGVLGKWLMGRAEIVKQASVEDCPKRTGHLSQTILKRFVEPYEGGLRVTVAAMAPYAAAVHEGAKPHDIPNAWGRGPTFGIGGRFDGKFHPGNKPNPFLSRNLRLAVAF